MSAALELESEFSPGDAPEFFIGCNDSRRWVFRVHTQSTVYGQGPQVVLRIEHRCYLRSGAEVRHQDWVQRRTVVELSANTEPTMLATIRAAHDTFLRRVQSEMDTVWLDTGKGVFGDG